MTLNYNINIIKLFNKYFGIDFDIENENDIFKENCYYEKNCTNI